MSSVFQKNDLLETNYLRDGRNLALNYFAKIRRDATAKDFFAVAFQAREVSAEWYFYKILDHSNRPILSRPFLKIYSQIQLNHFHSQPFIYFRFLL